MRKKDPITVITLHNPDPTSFSRPLFVCSVIRLRALVVRLVLGSFLAHEPNVKC